MKKSLPKLEQISQSVNTHQIYYTFNKMDEHISEKYRKGRVNAAKWLNDLIYYYVEKESSFLDGFKEHIQEQKKTLSELKEGDFKQGLFDELNLVEKFVYRSLKIQLPKKNNTLHANV